MLGAMRALPVHFGLDCTLGGEVWKERRVSQFRAFPRVGRACCLAGEVRYMYAPAVSSICASSHFPSSWKERRQAAASPPPVTCLITHFTSNVLMFYLQHPLSISKSPATNPQGLRPCFEVLLRRVDSTCSDSITSCTSSLPGDPDLVVVLSSPSRVGTMPKLPDFDL